MGLERISRPTSSNTPFHLPRRLSPKLKPFVQGDLDGLCAVYALINAFRLITADRQNLHQCDWQELFARLICAYPVAAHGANSRDIAKLARTGQTELRDRHGVLVELRWPLLDRRVKARGIAVKKLSELVQSRRTAVILGFAGKLEHWSVLERISNCHFILFDSGLHQRVRIDRCRLSREPDKSGHEHVIEPAAVLAVRAV